MVSSLIVIELVVSRGCDYCQFRNPALRLLHERKVSVRSAHPIFRCGCDTCSRCTTPTRTKDLLHPHKSGRGPCQETMVSPPSGIGSVKPAPRSRHPTFGRARSFPNLHEYWRPLLLVFPFSGIIVLQNWCGLIAFCEAIPAAPLSTRVRFQLRATTAIAKQVVRRVDRHAASRQWRYTVVERRSGHSKRDERRQSPLHGPPP